MAVDDHGGGVADEADIDSGSVEVDRGRVVVGGDHGDAFALAVFLPEVSESDSLVRVLGLWAAVDGAFRDVAQTSEAGEKGFGGGS